MGKPSSPRCLWETAMALMVSVHGVFGIYDWVIPVHGIKETFVLQGINSVWSIPSSLPCIPFRRFTDETPVLLLAASSRRLLSWKMVRPGRKGILVKNNKLKWPNKL